MNPSIALRIKKWKMLHKGKSNDIIKTLLNNRGFKTKKEIEEFLEPQLNHVTSSSVAIDKQQLNKSVRRIEKAIDNKEQIIIFGDYDVDGICGCAILWETLNGLGAKVMPYIPHRVEEGYGLSIKGIENLKSQIPNPKLIITVDNGIVANEAVKFANKQDIDIIITDHHVPSKKKPAALAIVHTTKLCGAGVAWMLASVILNSFQDLNQKEIPKYAKHASQATKVRNDSKKEDHLELVALATIADLVPLLGANRILTKYGLEQLRKTKRVGLLELFKEAGINSASIDTYAIGHIIAPRLNATGRITHAMDSLRLLCTKDRVRARLLAEKLGKTNRERQLITEETVAHASGQIRSTKSEIRKLLFIAHESYQQGVIGLVAGKLVEEFYRPAIVISKGEKYSKASARSVSGFNIVEFIRTASELLVDVGGHPMAAGFTVETAKLLMLEQKLTRLAEKQISDENLSKTLRIDCEINLDDVSLEFYKQIKNLAPFGMGNPQPTFVSKRVVIEDMRLVGNGGKHIKFKFQISNFKFQIDGIAFGMGERAAEFHIGDTADIVYTIEQDQWLAQRSLGEVGNGNSRLQLKIKDIKAC